MWYFFQSWKILSFHLFKRQKWYTVDQQVLKVMPVMTEDLIEEARQEKEARNIHTKMKNIPSIEGQDRGHLWDIPGQEVGHLNIFLLIIIQQKMDIHIKIDMTIITSSIVTIRWKYRISLTGKISKHILNLNIGTT